MVSSGVFILGVGAVDWYLNYLPRTSAGLLVGIALAIVGGALVAVGLFYSRAFGNAK
jgi:ABC-type cobalamin transport system permease subunit